MVLLLQRGKSSNEILHHVLYFIKKMKWTLGGCSEFESICSGFFPDAPPPAPPRSVSVLSPDLFSPIVLIFIEYW